MFSFKTWLRCCCIFLITSTGNLYAQEASLVLPIGHSCPVANVMYSPDSKYLFSIGEDGSAKLWEAETGLLIHDFGAIGDASIATVSDACFDRSGNNLVISYEGMIQNIWELATGKNCWDTIFIGTSKNPDVISQQISPDGERILTTNIADDNYFVEVYNKKDQLILRISTGKTAIQAAAFSNNGKQIFTVNEKNVVSIWNSITGKLVQSSAQNIEPVEIVKYSPDDKRIFLSSATQQYIYEIASKKATSLPGNIPNDLSAKINFSHDSRRAGILYSFQYNSDSNNFRHYYDSLIAWDIITGKQILRKGNIYLHSNDDVFSADDLTIAGISHNSIQLQNYGAASKKTFTIANEIAGYCFSQDNKYLALVDKDNRYSLFEAATSKKIIDDELLEALNGQSVYDINISNDGSLAFACNEYIVSYPSFQKINQDIYTSFNSKLPVLLDASYLADDQTIEIKTPEGFYYWNSQTGSMSFEADKQEDKRIRLSYGNQGNEISPDGNLSLYFGVNIIAVYKEGNDSIPNSTIFHSGLKETIRNAHFSPDSKKVVMAMQNNSIKVIDLEKQKMLFTLLPLKKEGYIVTDIIEDSLGYSHVAHFDGSDEARKQLYLACGSEIITLDQLKDLIWVPNLAPRLLKGEEILAKSLSELDVCQYLPLVELINKTEEADTYRITARRGGLGEITVLVNGTPTRIYHTNELVKKGNNYELVLPKKALAEYFVEGGENKITIKAFTADNSIATRGVSKIIVLHNVEKEAPNLYGVLIGVSQYKSDKLRLKYAAKDATEFSKVLKASAGKLLNSDTANHVFLYNMTTQDDRYQLPEKKAIRSLIQSIGEKARPNDIVVIFFAGHGVMAKDSSGSQFYFLTTEASVLSTNRELVKDVGISTNELADWMAPVNVKAQKRILIFDACNSGQAIRDMVSVGAGNQGFIAARNDDAAQQIKAIDKLNEKSGLFILSASASDQNAYESSKYAQGFLTYSLLKAIKDRPDILDGGQYLDVSRWFNAAKEYVSDIAKEAGERQEPQIVTNTNFNIGIVDHDVRSKIILPESKSIFTGSNFQNSDNFIADDNLDLNSKLNKQLQSAAAKDKSTMMYLIVSGSPDAYSLSGRYTTSDSSITAHVNLKKGKEIIQRFEITGQTNDLQQLAADIISRAIQFTTKSPE